VFDPKELKRNVVKKIAVEISFLLTLRVVQITMFKLLWTSNNININNINNGG